MYFNFKCYFYKNSHSGNWAQRLKKLKMFLLIVFYSILTIIYAFDAYKKGNELFNVYQNETITKKLNKEMEEKMETKTIRMNITNRTQIEQNQSFSSVNHHYI